MAGLDLLFPPKCILCDDSKGPFEAPTLCLNCWTRIFSPVELPGFGWAAGSYQGDLALLIRRAKFESDRLALRTLESVFVKLHAHANLSPPHAIVSVPGVPARIRKRGINLPHELARILARTTGIPYQQPWLMREREVPAQTGQSRAERLENLKGVFAADPECAKRTILVVDDVFTTGATAAAVDEALKAAGASSVHFFTLARTP